MICLDRSGALRHLGGGFSKTLDLIPKIWISGLHKMITSGLSTEYSVASFLFAREVIKLVRRSGFLFTATYLSQCSVCLQHYYADSMPMEGSVMSPYVSMTRSGIPRFISSFHRKVIRGKGSRKSRSDSKNYMSWFTVGRLVKLAKKPSKALFRSITDDTDWACIRWTVKGFIASSDQCIFSKVE